MNASRLLTTKQTAPRVGLKPQTLCVWRTKGRGDLPYVKIGSKVFYEESAIEQFIQRSRRTHTA